MRFQPVTPPLPIERYVSCVGRFAFGLPWPWEELPERANLVDATGGDLDNESLLHVWAPRTDGAYVTFLAWREMHRPDIERGLQQTAAQVTALYRGRPVSAKRILLGGTRAALIETETSGERIARLIAQWSDSSLQGEFRAPCRQWDAYLLHFHTMLGTWSWG